MDALHLSDLDTPVALIDLPRMRRNIERMQQRMDALGVRFRPHVKTSKSMPVVQAQLDAGACGITVSTLKEAAHFHAQGITDILYAVSVVPAKLPQVLALRRAGCDLKIIIDSVEGARAIVAYGQQHGERFEVWIEIDSDSHRSGMLPEGQALLDVAQLLHAGGMAVGGVMTHAGSSYDFDTPEALARIAEQERAACVRAAERVRAVGVPCPVVSVGSTPTALYARQLEGVDEVRAGVYVFFDLVMHNVGVCAQDEIALSVLTTVIGHQQDKGWAIVDAGWMAMSRDRGTQRQKQDFGYGQVVSLDGVPLAGYQLVAANQEHGILACAATPDLDIATRFPIGTRLRILPNHACATGAQYPGYVAVGDARAPQQWERLHGW